MSKTDRRPRAIPRTGADLARAARAAKAAIGGLLSPQRPEPAPEQAAQEPKSTGGYAGVIGAPPTVDRGDLPFEERPGLQVFWFPFPSSTSSQPVLPPIPDSKE